MDVVTMNIVESTMLSICREMGITMMKTSYSTIFNESLDFSCAIADANGDMIAVADYCPAQIGGMSLLIKSCIREMANEPVHEGDVILHNDPYRGGLHTPEHTFFTPILRRWRVHGLRGGDRPRRRGGRHGAGRLRQRGHGDLPRGPARPPGQDQEAGQGRGRGLEAPARERPHPSLQLRRLPGHDQRLRARRRAHGRADPEVRRAALPARPLPISWTTPKPGCGRRSRRSPTASTPSRTTWRTTGSTPGPTRSPSTWWCRATRSSPTSRRSRRRRRRARSTPPSASPAPPPTTPCCT